VFIACTPEPASLALAPCRCEELISRGIPAEKISLVLNRWRKGEISASDLEASLNHSVAAVFGNDYRTVSAASGRHGTVDRDTKLGRSFAAFAKKLSGEPEQLSIAGGALAFLKGFGAKKTVAPRI
jgi:Flp pilus assembly CpaE family ATPase